MDYRLLELLQEIKSLITNKPKADKWLDIGEAAKYCSVSPSTIYRATKKGILKVSQRTGKNLVRYIKLFRIASIFSFGVEEPTFIPLLSPFLLSQDK